MVYDNLKCLDNAERIVNEFKRRNPEDTAGHSLAWLIKEISGELNRFHALGRYSVIEPLERLVKKAKEDTP
jgi:hypothetical protein